MITSKLANGLPLPLFCNWVDRLIRALLEGRQEFQTWTTSNGKLVSLHEDLSAAKDTVKKIRELEIEYGMHVALAHDISWMLAAEDQVLLSLLKGDMQDFVKVRLAEGKYP